MNQKRAFIIINSTLGVIALLCVYYLFNSSYAVPPAVEESKRWVDFLKKPGAAPPPVADGQGEGVPEELRNLRGLRRIFDPVYQLPPTATPTPRPTPTPVPLAVVVNSWTLVSMDEKSVTVVDQKTSDEFEMTINVTVRDVEFQGQMYKVTLCGIDLEADTPTAKFCAGGSFAEKPLS